MKTITFIGNGNMALSIAKGLKENYKIEVIGRNLEKLNKFEDELGVEITKKLMDN
ncbi:NAD(P)-binding domain-containing protein [Candidatus Sulfurimonas marisnigri]|uniref:NAD(P)-binding domain-containing protein n=1 Tax=Candidatus Sulfurimonas marisnigri TaxID=2740405 RepID=UPI0032429C83